MENSPIPGRRSSARSTSKPRPSSTTSSVAVVAVAPKPHLHASRLGVAHRVAQRLLRHAIQHRRRAAPESAAPSSANASHVERLLLARLPREPLQRRGEAEVVEHARMHRVRQRCAPPRARRPPSRAASRCARRARATSLSCAATPSCSITAVSICAVESCSSRATRARSSSCALITCAASRRTRARSFGEPVEQRVERRADARHVAVGEQARRHARLEVARRHARRRELEIAQRTQRDVHEHEVHDEAQRRARCRGSRRRCPAARLPLGDDDDERGDDDEQVGAGELPEQRHAQRALGQPGQRRAPTARPVASARRLAVPWQLAARTCASDMAERCVGRPASLREEFPHLGEGSFPRLAVDPAERALAASRPAERATRSRARDRAPAPSA